MTNSSPEAVPLNSGELVPVDQLGQQPAEVLAEALRTLYDRQAQYKQWTQALEGEFHRRLKTLDRDRALFGRYEVGRTVTNTSEWDADALDSVLRDLIEDGTLQARECLGIISRTASASAAGALLGKLTGRAHAMVAECRSWKRKRSNKLLVTLAPEPDAANELDPSEVFPDEYRSLHR